MDTMGQDIFCLDLGLGGTPPSFTPDLYSFQDETPPLQLPEPRNPLTPWPARLPFDLALGGEPQNDTLARHGVTEDDYVKWALMPSFRRALAAAAKEIRDDGVTFKRICASIAEDFLPELDARLHDKVVPFAQKLDAFKTVTRLAGLEPKEEKGPANQNSNLVNIQINL